MSVEANAPGKLVLCGEYAVLEGAPAIVLAVDRRARVMIEDATDEHYRIDAPTLGVVDARCVLEANGRVRWINLDAADAQRLGVAAAVIEAVAAEDMPSPFRAELDTRAFFARNGSVKLGLGSSAALTVAFAGAMRAHDELHALPVERLIDAHCRAQQGFGSGLDVAASLRGGAIVYRMRDRQPQVIAAAWPRALDFCCVWSGQPADTGDYLRRLAAWRAHAPAPCARLMRELGEYAEMAATALQVGDISALCAAIVAYAKGLRRLGDASAIDIVSPGHRAIAAIAADCGVAYKPCGAAGDIGIALSVDSGRLRDFRVRTARAGNKIVGLKMDMNGVRLKQAAETHLPLAGDVAASCAAGEGVADESFTANAALPSSALWPPSLAGGRREKQMQVAIKDGCLQARGSA